jgi:transcriptional regulator GlxA family with amidase domain
MPLSTARVGSSKVRIVERLTLLAPKCSYDAHRIARALNLSKRHLQRLFASTLARPPQAWLNEQRMLAAKRMLRTAKSVKEVAIAMGFMHSTQFSRDFRRQFGSAPSTFLAARHR